MAQFFLIEGVDFVSLRVGLGNGNSEKSFLYLIEKNKRQCRNNLYNIRAVFFDK